MNPRDLPQAGRSEVVACRMNEANLWPSRVPSLHRCSLWMPTAGVEQKKKKLNMEVGRSVKDGAEGPVS